MMAEISEIHLPKAQVGLDLLEPWTACAAMASGTGKTKLKSKQWSCSDLANASKTLQAVKKEECDDDPEMTDEILEQEILATHLNRIVADLWSSPCSQLEFGSSVKPEQQ